MNLLKGFLDKKKQAKDDEEKEAERKAEGQGPMMKRAHAAYKTVGPKIGVVFNFLVDFLDGVSFVASELTFQTHFQVAVNAILFLRKVSVHPCCLAGTLEGYLTEIGILKRPRPHCRSGVSVRGGIQVPCNGCHAKNGGKGHRDVQGRQ